MGKIETTCQEKLRSEDTERPREASTEPKDRKRQCAPPSWASPSPLFADSPDVVVSSVSAATSTKRPAPSSEASSRTGSGTPSPTPNTPAERPSLLLMSSTLSRDKEEPSTASVDEELTTDDAIIVSARSACKSRLNGTIVSLE